MNIDDATINAFNTYLKLLTDKGYVSKNYADDDWISLTKWERLNHCVWMCENILNPSNAHYSLDKRSRHLGFIQAILINEGLTTIKKERDITRPWFTSKND